MTEHRYYRKRVVTVAAIEYTGDNYEAIEKFVDSGCGRINKTKQGQVFVLTLEGAMQVSVGDFVIRGIAGEFYPCKPAIFHATYDQVDMIDVPPEVLALT